MVNVDLDGTGDVDYCADDDDDEGNDDDDDDDDDYSDDRFNRVLVNLHIYAVTIS
jgi:hypothetical protein